MIFDTHAHYDDEAFDEDRDQLLSSMKDGGVGCIVNVCASAGGFDGTLKLMEAYPFVYGAVGVHPDAAEIMTQDTLDEIRRLSHMEKMVAIGEIGLDYYWHKEESEHQRQQEMFRAQMDIAREEKLPFMIHSRDAAEDTLNIVRDYMKKDMSGGIIHCFSYSKEIAAEYLKMGLYLGIGGVLTFKNAKKLKEVAAMAPLSQIVLETDCPYMSPEPHRGKRNSSLNLPYVAAALADHGDGHALLCICNVAGTQLCVVPLGHIQVIGDAVQIQEGLAVAGVVVQPVPVDLADILSHAACKLGGHGVLPAGPCSEGGVDGDGGVLSRESLQGLLVSVVAGLAAPPAHGQGNGIAAQASHGSSLGCRRSGAGSSAAIAAAGSQQTSCTDSTGDLQEITTGNCLAHCCSPPNKSKNIERALLHKARCIQI